MMKILKIIIEEYKNLSRKLLIMNKLVYTPFFINVRKIGLSLKHAFTDLDLF